VELEVESLTTTVSKWVEAMEEGMTMTSLLLLFGVERVLTRIIPLSHF
jgi:preprotein translocase subunit Sec63